MNSSFSIQISFNDEYLDEFGNIKTEEKVILLDAVTEPSTQSSNTITNHPIVSGDMVADHSYKNPLTMSFSASVALKGNNVATLNDVALTPSEFIDIFDKIKTRAYLCNIVKININNEKDIRFANYANMVITSINTTEYINTVTSSFSWQQVMIADVQTYDVDQDDEFLPNVTEPKTTSFTDAVLDASQTAKIISDYLKSVGLLTDEFLTKAVTEVADSAKAAIAGGIIAGVSYAAIAPTIAAICGASGPPGWVVGAIAAAGIFIVGIITSIANTAKTINGIKQFKYYPNDKAKNEQEVKRFYELVANLQAEMSVLNEQINVYQISSNEEQECMINIDNHYYIFTFVKNNTSLTYSLKVTDPLNNDAYCGGINNVFTSPSAFVDCNVSNALLKDKFVYCICPNIDNVKLTDCFIVASKINPKDFATTVYEILDNALINNI